MRNTAAGIQSEIAKGVFRPHTALTNMALAYYQNAANYFAKALFPTCPVTLSSDNYYEFSKEDLLRDNWQRKPAYGKVDPTVVGESMKPYVCQVDQMIMGIDQIRQTDLSRRQGPTTMQPKQQRVKTIMYMFLAYTKSGNIVMELPKAKDLYISASCIWMIFYL